MFLLGTTDVGGNIQEGINLEVSNDKLCDATVRRKFEKTKPMRNYF